MLLGISADKLLYVEFHHSIILESGNFYIEFFGRAGREGTGKDLNGRVYLFRYAEETFVDGIFLSFVCCMQHSVVTHNRDSYILLYKSITTEKECMQWSKYVHNNYECCKLWTNMDSLNLKLLECLYLSKHSYNLFFPTSLLFLLSFWHGNFPWGVSPALPCQRSTTLRFLHINRRGMRPGQGREQNSSTGSCQKSFSGCLSHNWWCGGLMMDVILRMFSVSKRFM